jgi:hypothetical protein
LPKGVQNKQWLQLLEFKSIPDIKFVMSQPNVKEVFGSMVSDILSVLSNKPKVLYH